MKKFFLAPMAFLLLMFVSTVAASPMESGCVKCHTDEAALKSLFKPSKISVEEGEG